MKKRFSLKSSLKLAGIVTVAVVVCLGVGLYRQEPERAKVEKTTESTSGEVDSVRLRTIRAPLFEEAFVLMYTENKESAVCWGYSDTNAVMAESSGYPGFGKPMLVIVKSPVTLFDSSIVTLSTSWGEYYYSVEEIGEGILTDSGDNVISKVDRREIIDFNNDCEKLYVFSTGKYWCCKMTAGTSVVL